MIHMNLKFLRADNNLSQEKLAEKLGVSRQAVAKWENGDALPDLTNCFKLSDIFKVSLDDLAKSDLSLDKQNRDKERKGRHVFAAVTVGERGQIVIPIKAREIFDINPGDKILVLGDEAQNGLALMKLTWMPAFETDGFPIGGRY